jgi:hypothetical protein
MSNLFRHFLKNLDYALVMVGFPLGLLWLGIYLTALFGPIMLPLAILGCVGLGAAMMAYLEAE